MDNPYAKQVKAGAAFLDVVLDEGWRNQIDIEELCFPDLDRCVLGQIYGDYHKALDDIDRDLDILGNNRHAQNLGFIIGGCMTFGDLNEKYRLLTEAWKEELIASTPKDPYFYDRTNL